jgi:hypothetical protein
MKIIFEGSGESSDRFIYAEYCTANLITIRIEDLKDTLASQEITLLKHELAAFIIRLQELKEQV